MSVELYGVPAGVFPVIDDDRPFVCDECGQPVGRRGWYVVVDDPKVGKLYPYHRACFAVVVRRVGKSKPGLMDMWLRLQLEAPKA